MCGINGIYNYQQQVFSEPKKVIGRMNEQIAHRGPDDQGCWSDQKEEVHFGHRRLSIIDLSTAGHQPMQLESNDDCLVFNGEIYNYQELIKAEKIESLRSKTDTEVLFYMLRKHGNEALQKFNGMFAFGYWNSSDEKLLLARDRAGQKPLYYTQHGGYFAFASELKSLLELPWVEKELDEAAFYDFLTFNQLTSPRTMFKGIFKLPPAHFMEVRKNGEVVIKEYWQPSNKILTLDEANTANRIFNLLEDSVKLRMRSDVEVGGFLSGGVDSSAVVGLMSNFTQKPISTFSIGFKGQDSYDEKQYAEKVAKRFHTRHHVKEVEPQDFKDLLPRMVDLFDEPLADTTCIPIYFLSKLASEEGVKVIQTGDGADELWGGYRNWQKYLKWNPYFSAYQKLPKSIKKLACKTYSLKKEGNAIHEMLQRAAEDQDFFWSSARGFKENTKKHFLSASFLKRNPDLSSYHSIQQLKDTYQKWQGNESHDFLHYLSFTGLKDVIPNLFLYRLDKLSMAHSIEGRTPFLDYRLIDLAFETPSSFKMKNREPKALLKTSLERLLPKEILYRQKMGFCVPIKEWGREIILDDLRQNLKAFCKDYELFDYASIELLIKKTESGEDHQINRLWTLYFTMNWFKRWMG